MIKKTVFKIKKGQKYSTGGRYPLWTYKGKTWNSIENLNQHFKIVDIQSYDKDCIVEIYEVIEKKIMETEIEKFFN